jgi:hypothetical protein
VALQAAVDALFARVRSRERVPRRIRAVPGHAVVEGKVRYARHDDCDVALPFVNALELAGDRTADSRVPIDDAPIPHPPLRRSRRTACHNRPSWRSTSTSSICA